MAAARLAAESLFDITIPPLASPEPEVQRGRKRRRDFFEVGTGRAAIESAESATFRGRSRYRSSSRYPDMSSLSRPTSQHRTMVDHHYRNTSGSPSPSRRKLIRIAQLATDCPRGQSPPQAQSLYGAYAGLGTSQSMAKRRRQRTQSRSRPPTSMPMGFELTSRRDDVKLTTIEAVVLPLTTYEIALPTNVSTAKESGEETWERWEPS
ncbi:hypothetical protein F4802DRAFT_117316 [Xylaria palmicola]|nr:hypothetical protein F4802DRAFT_117316 [Xylaria palmicola]